MESSFIAQMRTEDTKKRYSPGFGPQWHSFWTQGRIEPNRKIYDYELVYFNSGHCKVMFETEVYECSTGSVIIIPPNLLHCSVAMSYTERWCVHFDWFDECGAYQNNQRIFVYANGKEPFDETLIASNPDIPDVRFPFWREEVSTEILPLMKRYFLCRNNSFEFNLERRGILLQMLGLVFQKKVPVKIHTIGNKVFFDAKSIVDAGYLSSDFKVSDIAGQLGVSANYLTKLFRKMLGMSVMDYIHTQRLEHSCRLLTQTHMTVREVAFASGFNDANYFARFFNKYFGETPSSMRQKEVARQATQAHHDVTSAPER